MLAPGNGQQEDEDDEPTSRWSWRRIALVADPPFRAVPGLLLDQQPAGGADDRAHPAGGHVARTGIGAGAAVLPADPLAGAGGPRRCPGRRRPRYRLAAGPGGTGGPAEGAVGT